MSNTEWCLKKALEALREYDAATATDYVEMASIWARREIPNEKP